MAKTKTLSEQLEELQVAADQLGEYQKLFDKACQLNFNLSAKAIKKMTENGANNCSDFEQKLCNYFGLKSTSDKEAFLSIMCSDSSLKFFNSKRGNDEVTAAEQG